MIREAECVRERLQAFEVGPGADNDVHGRRVVGQNRWQRFDNGVDPFPWYKPSDREQQRTIAGNLASPGGGALSVGLEPSRVSPQVNDMYSRARIRSAQTAENVARETRRGGGVGYDGRRVPQNLTRSGSDHPSLRALPSLLQQVLAVDVDDVWEPYLAPQQCGHIPCRSDIADVQK
jgi:hypothetical protein